MVPKQLVSKRLVGMKKTLVAFLEANTKAMDLSFTALIAYSVLFGILLQESMGNCHDRAINYSYI